MKKVCIIFLSFLILTGCSGSVDEDTVEVAEINQEISEPPEETIGDYKLESPPVLVLKVGGQRYDCSNGTTSWYNFEADSDLEYWNGLYEDQVLEIGLEERIDIAFESQPDSIVISQRWKDRSDTQFISSGDFYINVDASEFDGDLIYQVKANWPEGYAFYVFRVVDKKE